MNDILRAPSTVELILQRVGRPYLIEAVRLVEAGEAGVLAIDMAAEAAGYPMGPLRQLDDTGLDVDLALDRALARMYPHGGRFEAPLLQVRLVEAGRRGRAAGRGFYRYRGTDVGTGGIATPDVGAAGPVGAVARVGAADPAGASRDDNVTPAAAPRSTLELSSAAIIERLELATVNEAYRVVEDGLGSPPAIDSIMRAAGHPLGPFEMVDRAGLRHIVDRLRALEAATAVRSGDQYRVASLLWQMATV
jgi:3-hydroxybutyryl-CoA dehydrogenase